MLRQIPCGRKMYVCKPTREQRPLNTAALRTTASMVRRELYTWRAIGKGRCCKARNVTVTARRKESPEGC